VGQGALAVEARDDGNALEIAGQLEHAESRTRVTAERAVLAALGGGCQAPMGCHAYVDGDTLRIIGVIVSPDGTQIIRHAHHGPATGPIAVGRELAQQLLEAGGKEILDAVYGAQA